MRFHLLVSTEKPASSKFLLSPNQSLNILRSVQVQHRKTLERDLLNLSSISANKFKKMPPKQQQQFLKSVADYPIPFFLYDKDSMKSLSLLIRSEDTIALHGEGGICTLGLEEESLFTITPYQLAKLFYLYEFPEDLKFNIELISCNLGSTWKSLNFAKICAQAFKYAFGFQAVHVIGYAGFVVEKKSAGKYSIALDIDFKKGQHASLDDAKVIYHGGHEIHQACKKANISHISFDYCKTYVDLTILERNKIIQTIVRKEVKKYLKPYSNAKSALILLFFDNLLRQIAKKGVSFIFPMIKDSLSQHFDSSDLKLAKNISLKPLTFASFSKIYQSRGYREFKKASIQRSFNSFKMFSHLTEEIIQQTQSEKGVKTNSLRLR